MKVWLKDGAECWLLVHLEVQSQSESGFEERMFVYSFRIFDLFRQIPVSLAILCDESQTWRPQRYGVEYPDTRLNFEFGVVKLLDWQNRMDELESSDNPFATVVMTHLKVNETKRSSQDRKAWKFRLTKALYEKGYERQQILDLYRFIDWVMILPESIEQEFWQELQVFEEERKVTYVTNAERFGFARGVEEGRKEGREEILQHERSLILRQLTRRLGHVSPEAEAQVRGLSLPQLEALGEALLDFAVPDDLGEWLRSC